MLELVVLTVCSVCCWQHITLWYTASTVYAGIADWGCIVLISEDMHNMHNISDKCKIIKAAILCMCWRNIPSKQGLAQCSLSEKWLASTNIHRIHSCLCTPTQAKHQILFYCPYVAIGMFSLYRSLIITLMCSLFIFLSFSCSLSLTYTPLLSRLSESGLVG